MVSILADGPAVVEKDGISFDNILSKDNDMGEKKSNTSGEALMHHVPALVHSGGVTRTSPITSVTGDGSPEMLTSTISKTSGSLRLSTMVFIP